MKKNSILALSVFLLAGISTNLMAQSPTIQKELRLVNPTSGGGYVGFKAADGTSTYTLNMPGGAPAANQVLTVSSISGSAVNLAWNSPDATGWSLSGNTAIASGSFLGTTDAKDLVFKTNNSTRMTLGASGSVAMDVLSGATGTASASNSNEGVVIADNGGSLTKASYASLVAAGLSTSTSGLTVGGPFTVSGLLTANNGATITGPLSVNGSINVAAATPFLLDGQAGAAGQILQSNGPGATPTWSSAFVKGRGVASANSNESIAVAFPSVDSDDAINVTLEGLTADMPIPSYYVVRSANTGFTIYFSAPFNGSCNWSVINQ